MADETISIELLVEAAKGAKNIGELRAAIEDMREEIEGLDRGSAAFNKLAGAIQSAESELKTIEKTFEGLEPQQIADSFVKVGEAVAGGFAAAQGAALLLGEENEDLQEKILKAQAAVSIAVGARAAAEGILQGRIAARFAVEKVSTAFTNSSIPVIRALNAVMAANPALLLVAALTALSGALIAFAASTEDARGAQELLNDAQNRAASTIAEERTELNELLAVARNEALSKDRRKEAIEAINAISPEYLGNINEENVSTAEVNQQLELYNDLIEKKATLDAIAAIKTEILEEQIKAQVDAQTGANVGFLDYVTSIQTGIDAQDVANGSTANLIATQNEELATLDALTAQYNEEVDAIERGTGAIQARGSAIEQQSNLEKERQKLLDEREKEAQKLREEIAKNNQELNDQIRQQEINRIEDSRERAIEQLNFDLELEQRKINELVADEELKNTLLQQLEEEHQINVQGIRDEARAEELGRINEQQALIDELTIANMREGEEKAKAERTAQFEAQILELEQQGLLTAEIETLLKQQLVDDLTAIEDQARQERLEKEQAAAEEERKLALETQQRKVDFATQTATSIIGLLQANEGENEASAKRAFERNKRLAIAQATIETLKGVQAIFASAAANPATILFPAQPFIQAGLALAAGIKNINQIRQQKFQGGGGLSSSGGGGSLGGATSGINAGNTPVTDITGEGDQADQPTQQQPVQQRVFVVESDITDRQGDIANIEETATIG